MSTVKVMEVNPRERTAATAYFAQYDPMVPVKPWEIVLPGFYRVYIPMVQRMRYVGLIELGEETE